MLFNSMFRKVNVTLLQASQICPQCCMLHVLKSEVFIRGGGEGGELGPLFLNFLDPPLGVIHLGLRPRWITSSETCRILRNLLSLIQ